jgi:3-carboxy-cis,cis-muconate cycloisomerase
MSSHLIDSKLLGARYGTDAMRRIFDDENRVRQWLKVEIALARAEAKYGLIPPQALEELEKVADVKNLNFESLRDGIHETTQVLMPLIKMIKNLCHGGGGEYFHWGATTQDILDTGFILQIKEALEIIYRDLREVEEKLLELARHHRDTLMVGRTHGQHALPLTFGFKVSVWVREVRRNIERLKECRSRLLVGQLAGGVGTFASFGEKGSEIQSLVMKELGLQIPDICWHSSRDRIGELGCLLTLIANTFGKIANELYLLQKTDVMEIEEHFAYGKIGSSTMPHKRNPRLCEGIISLAKLVQGSALTTLESMCVDHERDAKFMGIEWVTISESFIMLSGLLDQAKHLFEGLQVNEEKMFANTGILKGLILSERVMLTLGKKTGRQSAHEIVYRISMEAFEKGIDFKKALLKDKEFSKYFEESEVDEMLDPKQYVGLSGKIVNEVLAMTKEERKADEVL